MILPFEMRNRSKPVATYGLPVGGLPNNGPVFVPLFVHLISTLSPFEKISSCTSFLSGTAAILQLHISLFLLDLCVILQEELDCVKQNQTIEYHLLPLVFLLKKCHRDNEEPNLHFVPLLLPQQ